MGYHLLTKTRYWEETHTQVDLLSLEDLIKAAAEIKTTEKCSNPAILILECYIQIVASRFPHSFVKCFEQRLIIRALMISNGISPIWVTLNVSDFCSFLILILAEVQLENNGLVISTGEFGKITAIMNPVAVAQFFEAACTSIFKRLFAARSTQSSLLGPVSTYFGTMETNGCRMLYLYYLV